jgi:hypothetical protein
VKMDNNFVCFITKKIVFSQVLQLPVYKSILFYFEFHFTVKKKLVKNCISFPMNTFQFFFIKI